MSPIDLELVKRAQRADEHALRNIIDRLHRPILATIHRFLGSRFADQVEDIGQEVFLRVFRSLGQFDPDRGVKFTTWVFAFVRNYCLDVLKRRRLFNLRGCLSLCHMVLNRSNLRVCLL